MMMRRRMILVLSLAAAIALSVQALVWSPDSGGPGALPEIVQPVTRVQAATLRQPPPVGAGDRGATSDSLQLRARPTPARTPRDLFAAYSWQPPPPVQAASALPQLPQAPALPFSYLGRLEVEGKPIFLLLQGERTLKARIGEPVGEFTLQSSGPRGLVFLHRPTGLTEVLVAPGAPIASN